MSIFGVPEQGQSVPSRAQDTPPNQATALGPQNVPQGNPDDGQNFVTYTQETQQTEPPRPVRPSSPPNTRKYSGNRETAIITVREELPRGGFLHHDFLVEHSGFGHYRVANAGPDEPYYESEEAVREAIRGQKFVGSITFGTMDAEKGWMPE